MKIELSFHPEGRRRLRPVYAHDPLPKEPVEAIHPYADADFVRLIGASCPCCGIQPLEVQGRGKREQKGSSIFEPATCKHCTEHVGTLKVTRPTLFGLEEDFAVIHQSRPKVF